MEVAEYVKEHEEEREGHLDDGEDGPRFLLPLPSQDDHRGDHDQIDRDHEYGQVEQGAYPRLPRNAGPLGAPS